MNRRFCAAILCFAATTATFAGNNAEVVTNPTPAVSATMQLVGFDANRQGYVWNVSGKVKPAYRGHGANVKLVCMRYDCFTNGSGCGANLVFPPPSSSGGGFDEGLTGNVDACGNFAINALTIQPQLDNSWVCTFVVHVDDSNAPQACSGKASVPGPVEDPNGTAPCSGGLCPNAP